MSTSEIQYFGATDVGRLREHNEDAFHFDAERHYGILADGMGGRLFGEVAAQMTVDLIRDRFENFFPSSVRELAESDQAHSTDMVVNMMDDWINDANYAVWKKGQDDPKYREMGTTVVVFYAFQSVIVIGYVGDSRAYHASGNEMSQLTEDHSFVNSQLRSGDITAEEAAVSAQRNIITRAIGTEKRVKPDYEIVHVKEGDRILICSDGLSDMLPDNVIVDTLQSQSDGSESLRALIDEANAAGGKDNITMLLLDYVSEDSRTKV